MKLLLKYFIRYSTSFLCTVIVATSSSLAQVPDNPKTLRAHRTSTPPTIDGVLREAAWAEAERAVGFSNFDQPDSTTIGQTIGRVLFDDEHLYIGFECLESRMDLLRSDLATMGHVFDYTMAEVVEVFLDPNAAGNADYAQFMVSANGASMGSFYDAMQIGALPYRTAVSLGEDRFFVELAIPLSMLHLGPGAGAVWGFNLNRARMVERETSGGPNDNRFSSWNNTGGAFNRPHMFGRLEFDLDTSRYWYDVKLLQSPSDFGEQTKIRIVNRTGQFRQVRMTLTFDDGPRKTKTYEQLLSLDHDGVTVATFAGPFPSWHSGATLNITLTDASTGKKVYEGQTRSTDVTPGHHGDVPEYSQHDTESGFVLFTKNYNTTIFRTYLPSLDEVDKPLILHAAPGEYEPCVLGVRTLQKLTDVKVDIVGDLVSSNGRTIGSDNVDLGIITETKYWTDRGAGQEYRWQPMLVEPQLPDELPAKQTYIYWITVKVPPGTAADRYTGELRFRTAGTPVRHVPMHVTVWPFELATPPQMCWGYYYDVARMPNALRTLDYQKKVFQNLAAYGINNTTIYGGTGSEGSLDACGSQHLPFAATMNDALAAGAMTRGIPAMTLGSNITTQSMAAARLKYDWPPLLMYAYDEPDDDERIAVARKGLAAIKKAHPEVQTVTAISEKGLVALGDLYDAWVVGAQSIDKPIVAEGRDKGKLIWMYDCGNRVCDLIFNRYFAGLFSWKTRVKGNWLWGLVDIQFTHRMKRPMVEALKHDNEALWRLHRENPDDFNFTFNYIWPALDGPIPSVGHIGRREGIDDYKYIYTLRQMIHAAETSNNPKIRSAAQESEKYLETIFSRVSVTPHDNDAYRQDRKEIGGDFILGDWRPSICVAVDDFNQFRKGIAEQIIALQRAAKY